MCSLSAHLHLTLQSSTISQRRTVTAHRNCRYCPDSFCLDKYKELLETEESLLASQTHNNHFSERRMTTTVLYKPLEISLNISKGIRKHIVLEIVSNTSDSVFSVMYAGMSLIPVYFQVLTC